MSLQELRELCHDACNSSYNEEQQYIRLLELYYENTSAFYCEIDLLKELKASKED